MAVPTLSRSLASDPRQWMDLCRHAESSGFHSVWTGDTAGTDAFVDAAYAVSASESLTVGIGVALPTRSPLQTASAAAALALPGRTIILGLAAGNPTVNMSGHGIGYAPIVARMRDFVECVTALLRAPRGEPVDMVRRHSRLRGHGFGLGRDRVQIVLGAYGPAMTALAGEITDGLLVHLLTPRTYISEHLEAAKASHSGDQFLRAAGVMISVHDDETEAMNRARGVLSTVLKIPRFAARLDGLAPGSNPDHLDDGLVRQFVLVSTPARLLDDIAGFADADVLVPVPISLFLPPGEQADEAREAVLTGFSRRAPGRATRG